MNSPFREPAPPPPEPFVAGTRHAPLLAVPEPEQLSPPLKRAWPWWGGTIVLACIAHLGAKNLAALISHERAYVPWILGLAVVVPLAGWLGLRAVDAGLETAQARGRSHGLAMLGGLGGILAVLAGTAAAWSLGFA